MANREHTSLYEMCLPKQNATTLELARDLSSKNLSSFLFSYNALQIADPCKCSMQVTYELHFGLACFTVRRKC